MIRPTKTESEGTVLYKTIFSLAKKAGYYYDLGDLRAPKFGRFRGCSVMAPYYWELASNGLGDEVKLVDDSVVKMFCVNSEESRIFGVPCGSRVLVWENLNGKVELDLTVPDAA